ncbi:hypothetical protein P280DRAFT_479397 [Massarina eburnea CBS 473.64]|uniref:Uncharacterized protein n=1 Tax=Massarina eburnea CBS 473.64 TaxID=1395130 RepID=A0A6A6S4F7_9PLEO|nr:hypothetical protein P280DRAFT_479397 [Massarina eburnea CBS 473.64]
MTRKKSAARKNARMEEEKATGTLRPSPQYLQSFTDCCPDRNANEEQLASSPAEPMVVALPMASTQRKDHMHIAALTRLQSAIEAKKSDSPGIVIEKVTAKQAVARKKKQRRADLRTRKEKIQAENKKAQKDKKEIAKAIAKASALLGSNYNPSVVHVTDTNTSSPTSPQKSPGEGQKSWWPNEDPALTSGQSSMPNSEKSVPVVFDSQPVFGEDPVSSFSGSNSEVLAPVPLAFEISTPKPRAQSASATIVPHGDGWSSFIDKGQKEVPAQTAFDKLGGQNQFINDFSFSRKDSAFDFNVPKPAVMKKQVYRAKDSMQASVEDYVEEDHKSTVAASCDSRSWMVEHGDMIGAPILSPFRIVELPAKIYRGRGVQDYHQSELRMAMNIPLPSESRTKASMQPTVENFNETEYCNVPGIPVDGSFYDNGSTDKNITPVLSPIEVVELSAPVNKKHLAQDYLTYEVRMAMDTPLPFPEEYRTKDLMQPTAEDCIDEDYERAVPSSLEDSLDFSELADTADPLVLPPINVIELRPKVHAEYLTQDYTQYGLRLAMSIPLPSSPLAVSSYASSDSDAKSVLFAGDSDLSLEATASTSRSASFGNSSDTEKGIDALGVHAKLSELSPEPEETPASSEMSGSHEPEETTTLSEMLGTHEPEETHVLSEMSRTHEPEETLALSEPSGSPKPEETPVLSEPSESPEPEETPALSELSESHEPEETPVSSEPSESPKPEETPALSELSESHEPEETPVLSEPSESPEPEETPALSEMSESHEPEETPVLSEPEETPALSEMSESYKPEETPVLSEPEETPALSEMLGSPKPAALSEVSGSHGTEETPALSELSEAREPEQTPVSSEVSGSPKPEQTPAGGVSMKIQIPDRLYETPSVELWKASVGIESPKESYEAFCNRALQINKQYNRKIPIPDSPSTMTPNEELYEKTGEKPYETVDDATTHETAVDGELHETSLNEEHCEAPLGEELDVTALDTNLDVELDDSATEATLEAELDITAIDTTLDEDLDDTSIEATIETEELDDTAAKTTPDEDLDVPANETSQTEEFEHTAAETTPDDELDVPSTETAQTEKAVENPEIPSTVDAEPTDEGVIEQTEESLPNDNANATIAETSEIDDEEGQETEQLNDIQESEVDEPELDDEKSSTPVPLDTTDGAAEEETFLGTQSLRQFLEVLYTEEGCTTRNAVTNAFYRLLVTDRRVRKLPPPSVSGANPMALATSFIMSRTLVLGNVSLSTFLGLFNFSSDGMVDVAAAEKAFKQASALGAEIVKEQATGDL